METFQESKTMTPELTRWIIYAALLAYLAAAMLLLAARREGGLEPLARAVWTFWCLACLAHVLSAFHFQHAWSHAAAYEHVARRTEEAAGWNWGGGLYVNYLFITVLLCDALWWWLRPLSYRIRPRSISVIVHGFTWFIVFNATAVFGEGLVRWCGVAGTALLAACWWRARREGGAAFKT
jgi:hypothetical protein